MVLATVMANTSETLAPARSVAVTLTLMLPTSPLRGVPLKVRVGASKASQVGSGAPPASVALKVRLSSRSTSAKVVVGTTKLKSASSVAAWSAKASATVGASLTFKTGNVGALVKTSGVPWRSV